MLDIICALVLSLKILAEKSSKKKYSNKSTQKKIHVELRKCQKICEINEDSMRKLSSLSAQDIFVVVVIKKNFYFFFLYLQQ